MRDPPIPGSALLVQSLTGCAFRTAKITTEGNVDRGEKINDGRPARHPAGARRAFKFAPGKFVEPQQSAPSQPTSQRKKAACFLRKRPFLS